MLPLSFVVAVLTLISGVAAQGQETLAASIKSQSNYKLLQACVQQCVWDIGDNDVKPIGGDIALQFGCGSPYYNGCLCAVESASRAHSFITSCASYLCPLYSTAPNPDWINSATSVYASYCGGVMGAVYTGGAPAEAPASSTTTSPAAGITRDAASSRQTSSSPRETDSSPTSSPSTSTPEKKDKKIMGLSMGAFIGVVISVSCSVLGLLFGIGFKVYKHKKQVRLQREQIERSGYFTTKS
ncbi:hypothetical protein P154DRAFT_150928 [Amniculicola lignicola CBS 123094]|uniref:Extracellular membrane protein CFEM domain-containing protein n=1 Tax=Amniculicola lignicola CBS 123094 TaxID=1392246 RepID=A0A6A5WM41_9PLEO|nr:hypothetical protein P154DRAFT_150928 [Amniculicola lignicola CBS 123094]